ncbi:hypothetical protein LSH36_400g00024 [Paralvinella palmiformis]|uniref:Uncharacterized protein n=1 Tax=Paralvinella palmiformis TaxID=53620 RepID=A0AAD9MYV8_9ANNE|nr:hypothetical protein LSH36_400g00024 [Paralvinella palmiformis]
MKLILMTVIAVLCSVSWGAQVNQCSSPEFSDCVVKATYPCSARCGPGTRLKDISCINSGMGDLECSEICYGQHCSEDCDHFSTDAFCSRKAYGRCSKTCGVGTFTSRFLCVNMNYTCTTPCCCSQCEPGGSGKPSV